MQCCFGCSDYKGDGTVLDHGYGDHALALDLLDDRVTQHTLADQFAQEVILHLLFFGACGFTHRQDLVDEIVLIKAERLLGERGEGDDVLRREKLQPDLSDV